MEFVSNYCCFTDQFVVIIPAIVCAMNEAVNHRYSSGFIGHLRVFTASVWGFIPGFLPHVAASQCLGRATLKHQIYFNCRR